LLFSAERPAKAQTIFSSVADPDPAFHFDADPDPASQNDPDIRNTDFLTQIRLFLLMEQSPR
jgi:hypothetical protein